MLVRSKEKTDVWVTSAGTNLAFIIVLSKV